jgi:predicted DNA binding CopG/RHH family protein
VAIATAAAPSQPPPQVHQDGATTLNLRLRKSSLAAIAARAQEQGMTLKQVICHALAGAGVGVADSDLEDRTPRRRS